MISLSIKWPQQEEKTNVKAKCGYSDVCQEFDTACQRDLFFIKTSRFEADRLSVNEMCASITARKIFETKCWIKKNHHHLQRTAQVKDGLTSGMAEWRKAERYCRKTGLFFADVCWSALTGMCSSGTSAGPWLSVLTLACVF